MNRRLFLSIFAAPYLTKTPPALAYSYIINAFDIPDGWPVMSVTFDNTEEKRQQFFRWTIVPLLEKWENNE